MSKAYLGYKGIQGQHVYLLRHLPHLKNKKLKADGVTQAGQTWLEDSPQYCSLNKEISILEKKITQLVPMGEDWDQPDVFCFKSEFIRKPCFILRYGFTWKLKPQNPDETVNYNKHSLEIRTDIFIKLQTYFAFSTIDFENIQISLFFKDLLTYRSHLGKSLTIIKWFTMLWFTTMGN